MKYITTVEGIPGTTVRVPVTDLVQQFDATVYILNNHPAISMLIQCEDESIRYAYGVDPDQGANPVGHILYAGQTLPLINGRMIREFRFINEANGVDGILQVTPGYEIGVN